MEHFLINSSVCLFIMWLAYKLLLENTSWHGFKRFYLIGALIISVLIPFIVVETIVIPIEETTFMDYDLNTLETVIEKPAFEVNWFYVMLGVYAVGFGIMLWRFIKNLNSFRIQQEDEVSSYKAYQLILRNQITIPHSFLKRIFIAKKDHESKKIPSVVLEHEKAHLDQKHSLDILFIELLIMLLWFNPLLYIIRYSMKLNHEFLADQSVINQGVSTTEYQQILLDHATTSYQQAMANTFTFPIIKKRFHIMKIQTSHTSLLLRSLALIPVLALLIISCGKEETQFIEVEEIIEIEEVNHKKIIVDGSKESGYVTINGKIHYYVIEGDKTLIFDRYGNKQDLESQGYEVIAVIEEVIEVEELPVSNGAINYIKTHKDELNYYLGKNQISADAAINIIEKNGQHGVEISPDANGINSIKIKETEQNKNVFRTSGSNEKWIKGFETDFNLKGKSKELQSVSPTAILKSEASLNSSGNENLNKSMVETNKQITYTSIKGSHRNIFTIDANVQEGEIMLEGENYTYNSKDLNDIRVYNQNNQMLSQEKIQQLKIGFRPVWWNGKEKTKEILRNSKIIESFKNNKVALHYKGGYTKNYEEALQFDATDMFVYLEQKKDHITITLGPHSWAKTNSNYQVFKKYF